MRQNTIRDDTAARHRRKYHNSNPIQQFVLSRFFRAMSSEVRKISPTKTLEFGCGEGYFLDRVRSFGATLPDVLGIDLRSDALIEARRLNPDYQFECIDLMTWGVSPKSFDLVIASEVLEHLIDPELYLDRLVSLTNNWLLLSVPWEPWFQLSNFARGRDWSRWGNHPEHINRWKYSEFVKFIDQRATVVRAYTVFPFTVVVAQRPEEA